MKSVSVFIVLMVCMCVVFAATPDPATIEKWTAADYKAADYSTIKDWSKVDPINIPSERLLDALNAAPKDQNENLRKPAWAIRIARSDNIDKMLEVVDKKYGSISAYLGYGGKEPDSLADYRAKPIQNALQLKYGLPENGLNIIGAKNLKITGTTLTNGGVPLDLSKYKGKGITVNALSEGGYDLGVKNHKLKLDPSVKDSVKDLTLTSTPKGLDATIGGTKTSFTDSSGKNVLAKTDKGLSMSSDKPFVTDGLGITPAPDGKGSVEVTKNGDKTSYRVHGTATTAQDERSLSFKPSAAYEESTWTKQGKRITSITGSGRGEVIDGDATISSKSGSGFTARFDTFPPGTKSTAKLDDRSAWVSRYHQSFDAKGDVSVSLHPPEEKGIISWDGKSGSEFKYRRVDGKRYIDLKDTTPKGALAGMLGTLTVEGNKIDYSNPYRGLSNPFGLFGDPKKISSGFERGSIKTAEPTLVRFEDVAEGKKMRQQLEKGTISGDREKPVITKPETAPKVPPAPNKTPKPVVQAGDKDSTGAGVVTKPPKTEAEQREALKEKAKKNEEVAQEAKKNGENSAATRAEEARAQKIREQTAAKEKEEAARNEQARRTQENSEALKRQQRAETQRAQAAQAAAAERQRSPTADTQFNQALGDGGNMHPDRMPADILSKVQQSPIVATRQTDSVPGLASQGMIASSINSRAQANLEKITSPQLRAQAQEFMAKYQPAATDYFSRNLETGVNTVNTKVVGGYVFVQLEGSKRYLVYPEKYRAAASALAQK